MRRENVLILLLSATVILIFLFPSIGWNFRMFLVPQQKGNADVKSLALENQTLKTELAKLKAMKSESSPRAENMLQAFVYSDYPLNFKNRLLINAGESDGVKEGQPVFVSYGSSSIAVVGRINQVFDKYSVVRTIFDSGFQMSVRIGSPVANALLRGGNDPQLTLIPKDAKISDGDAVYSSGPEYPFGSSVGLARNARFSSDQFFMDADLDTAYSLNDIATVFIDTTYDVKSSGK